LKLARMPQTNETISAASRPKFTILYELVGEILLLNEFFSDCRYVPQLPRYSPTKLCDGVQMANFWRFFVSCIAVSRVQHISDMHSKFALQGHTMCGSNEVW